MLRRRIIDEPISGLAVWARRLAVFALAVAALAVVALRAGLAEVGPGLVTFGAALAIAVVAILFAIGAFIVIWREGARGFGLACSAILIGAALLAYPAYLGIKGFMLPALTDVSTDTDDPPRFETVARLRPRGANPVAYPGAAAARMQQAAYPEVEPLDIQTNLREAFNAALAAVTRRKWAIVDVRPPLPGRRDGHIEAVARTAIMGFADDVVIRIRGMSGGSRIDIRSASRFGRHDFGTNAQRVRSLSDEIEEAVANQAPARR